MRIKDVKVTNFELPMPPIVQGRFRGNQEVSLLRVITDEGLEGYGMARAHGGMSGTVIGEMIVRVLKPLLVGQDPLNRERLWHAMWGQERVSYLPAFPIATVDVALWDLAGKILGAPVYQMLGGFRERIKAYASSAFLSSVDDYLKDAHFALGRGVNSYKIHPFQEPVRDVELCRILRKDLGPGIGMMLDVGRVYDRMSALRVGRVLEELDFVWYEEPLSHYDIQGYAELSRDLDIPVIGAEAIGGSAYSAAAFLRQNALDMVEIDVYWKGGITGALKIAHLCEAMGLKVASHHGGSSLMNLANLHVLCGIQNADSIEVLVPEEKYGYGLKSPIRVDPDGFVSVPPGPGLGAEIDWDYVKSHTTGEL